MRLQPGAIYRQCRRPIYKACRRGVPGDPSLTYPQLPVGGPLPLPSDCPDDLRRLAAAEGIVISSEIKTAC